MRGLDPRIHELGFPFRNSTWTAGSSAAIAVALARLNRPVQWLYVGSTTPSPIMRSAVMLGMKK
jgi:hypothetical protein